jgi:hypothetical protein
LRRGEPTKDRPERDAAGAAGHELQDLLRQSGLDEKETAVLAALQPDARDEASLAVAVGLDRSELARVLDRLVKSGLVIRDALGRYRAPDPGRLVQMLLTPRATVGRWAALEAYVHALAAPNPAEAETLGNPRVHAGAAAARAAAQRLLALEGARAFDPDQTLLTSATPRPSSPASTPVRALSVGALGPPWVTLRSLRGGTGPAYVVAPPHVLVELRNVPGLPPGSALEATDAELAATLAEEFERAWADAA